MRWNCADMHIGSSIVGATVADAWEKGLQLFRSPAGLYRHDSERGVAFEILGLNLIVESTTGATVPAGYRFPDLISDYEERIFGAERERSLLYQRMHNWALPGENGIDQIAGTEQLLRQSPDTRAAAFSLWRPEEDLDSGFPVSPISGCFRIVAGKLRLLLVARSVDYWVGAVPELLVYSKLANQVAERLNISAGSLVYHMWSAHIYEDDCLAHLADTVAR